MSNVLSTLSTEELRSELKARDAVEAAKKAAETRLAEAAALKAKTAWEKDRREAMQEISEKRTAALALVNEAIKLADDFGIHFDFSVAYGMGGTYIPKKPENTPEHLTGDWATSEEDCYGNAPGWKSSSNNC